MRKRERSLDIKKMLIGFMHEILRGIMQELREARNVS